MAYVDIADPKIQAAVDKAQSIDWSQYQSDETSGRTANSDGNKTGGGGKFWTGMNNAATWLHNLLGGNTTNVTNNTGSSGKMSAGVWIAIGGVLLVLVVLVAVLATRNK